jgi:thioredoxin-like negative regulator of GroEL
MRRVDGAASGSGRARATARRSPERGPAAPVRGVLQPEVAAVPAADKSLGELLRRSRLPVLLEFACAWSEPSRVVSRQVAELAERYRGRLHVLRADSGGCPEWTARLRIVGAPAVLLIHRGREYGRIVGVSRPQTLERAVERLLALAAPAGRGRAG